MHSTAKYRHHLTACAAFWLLCAVCSGGPVTNTLPWSEGFESYDPETVLMNTNGWSTGPDNQALVKDVGAYQASQCAYLPALGVITNWVDSGSAGVVWADFFAKVVFRDEAPEIDATTSAQFYFDTNGYAVVQDGPSSNWITLASNMWSVAAVPVTTAQWTRISVIHNYTDKKWALMVNDKLLKDNIRFINSGVTKMSQMVVSNKVYLDSIVVDADYPDGGVINSNSTLAGDADTDGMPDYWEIYHFEYATVQDGSDDYDQDGRTSVSEYYKGTDPTNASSFFNSLAYRDGFESASTGAVSGVWRGITVSGGVSLQTAQKVEGSKAVALSAGSVSVAIDDNDATNVWVQVYSKPTPVAGNPAALQATQVAGFLVLTNGILMAYDGDHWTNCDTISSVQTNVWMGFAVHLDYNADKYDLYVSTNAVFGDHMKRAHSTNLAFNSAASAVTKLASIVVTNKSTDIGYIDVLAASRAYTNVTYNTDTNLASYDRLAGRTTSAQMPPYVYDAGNDILSGKVGTDLMRELLDGDKIQVYSNGWNVYYLNTTWQYESGAAIADLPINESMGMLIQRGAGVDAVAFYPYSNVVVMSQDVYVTGTNDLVTAGWNQLASPFAETRYPNAQTLNYGFPNAAVGDTIFFPTEWIYYNGSKWKKSGVDAATALTPGQTFWYWHKGNGMYWDVDGQ